MSVTSVGIKRGLGGSKAAGDSNVYTVVYYAVTSSANDGAQVVLSSAMLPQDGHTYIVGNDSDVFATVQSRRARQVASKRWEITITYGPRDEQKNDKQPQVDPDGNPVDDPLLEKANVSIRSRQITRIVERAKYLGQVTEPGNAFQPVSSGINSEIEVNEVRSITNSAGVPFDPPVESEYTQAVIRISRPALDYKWDRVRPFMNSLNTDVVSIPRAGIEIQPFEGMMIGHDAVEVDRNGRLFWRESFEILHDKEGFYWDLLDRGYSAGVASSGTSQSSTTASSVQRIRDGNGAPVAEPVLLDGGGLPLDSALGVKAMYLRYVQTNIIEWSTLNLGAPGRVF